MPVVVLLAFVTLAIAGCDTPKAGYEVPKLDELSDSLIESCVSNVDSLESLYHRFEADDDKVAMMYTLSEIGKAHRNEARFYKAIQCHKEGVVLAQELCDTVEMIYGYNHVATNYRRLGILDEASTYHFFALSLCANYSDHSSETARKMKANTLNGLGNIYLTLKNYSEADSLFREAMRYETARRNPLGMAINYANIGSIFEQRNMPDSARAYYLYSLAYNEQANSNLGRALCYIHLGNLSEDEGLYVNAKEEYMRAYSLMSVGSDKWHKLEAMLALSRINILMDNYEECELYLKGALDIAQEIKSWEHLARVHELYYEIAEKEEDYQSALKEYQASVSYNDSVTNSASKNHLLNMRVKYERDKSSRELEKMQEDLDRETQMRNLIVIAFVVFFVLFLFAFISLVYAFRMKQKSEMVLKRMGLVRNNFFTNITHEFRTPLTIIRGMTELLENYENMKDEDVRDCVYAINKQGSSLLELVNQLLDISKVSAEIEEPEWRNGDMVAHLRMLTESFKMYARQKYIDVTFYTDKVTFDVDFVPSYVTKIIRNLVSNALKFTPKGGVVKITLRSKENNVVIEVSDTGVGLRAEEKEHVFDMFYQAGDTRVAGSGVGLALVKRLVDKLGGEITVDSSAGVGTTFCIVLPGKHTESRLQRWVPTRENIGEEKIELADVEILEDKIGDENDSRPLIMVIDDNVDIAKYIGRSLGEKYRVAFADDGLEGLSKAQEYVPDLLITDLMMPEMNGYELCRRVRKSDVISHIPIIILSAKCTEEDRIKGYEMGADAYLMKPFNADELNARVSVLLEQRRLLRSRYTQVLFAEPEQNKGMASSDVEFITKLNEFVNKYMNDRTFVVEQLAEKMCMSVSQLNRKVKSITGLSPANYIMHIRLERGKRMLSLTDKSIGDISYECGFSDASHFGRIFKQTYNMTPSQYRKMPKIG